MDPLEVVASRIFGHTDSDRVAVAIDGGDAAGKTTFADRLAEVVGRERPVIRVQADHFEHPRSIRYRRGASSPEGYFEDTYDHDALERLLLEPFERGQPVVRGINDWHTDTPLELEPEPVFARSVLIVDGGFLLQTRFRERFDVTVFLNVPADVRLARAIPRGLPYFKSSSDLIERFQTRYLPGHELYLKRERPMEHADIVIDNSDFERSVVTVNRDSV